MNRDIALPLDEAFRFVVERLLLPFIHGINKMTGCESLMLMRLILNDVASYNNKI